MSKKSAPDPANFTSVDLLNFSTSIKYQQVLDKGFMKWMLAVLLFFAALGITEAQNIYTIQGKIFDKMTLEPLEGVLVRLVRTGEEVLTNEAGKFSLATSQKETGILEISLLDYRS